MNLTLTKPLFHQALLIAFAIGSMLAMTGCGGDSESAAVLKITGSTTVNLPVADAAEILRDRDELTIFVDTQGGSSGGVAAIGEGLAQLGMASRPITDKDRAKFPQADFVATTIGSDALALVVSKGVWEGGVKSLDREQVQGIYEGKVSNWKILGGPDQEIVFFNKEPGRGTWEVFANWLYGDADNAPSVNHAEVGANEEARSKVASTRGAISQLSAAWADGETVFAIGIAGEDGTVVQPDLPTVLAGNYPIARPLNLLTNGTPTGETKSFIDFMLGEQGQKLVSKHGYLPLGTGAE
jgi:phosphate transport system substrate-binding protein